MPISRSSICRVLCLALAAATVAANLQRAGAFEITSKSLLAESWDGFDADYQPDWVGSTKKVNWNLLNAAIYGRSLSQVISMHDFGTFLPYVYDPIELLTSSRSVYSSVEAAVQIVNGS